MSARAWLPAVLLAGCATAVAPGPPATVRSVAVLQPSNRTGDPLLVSGTSFLEKYAFRSARVTVPDLLAAMLRAELGGRGFEVVSAEAMESAAGGRAVDSPDAAAELARHARVDAPVLLVAIERWEPDVGVQPDYVIVGLDATLIEPATGKMLWHTRRRARPSATPGAVTLGSAYEIAAEQVVGELLDAWVVPHANP